MTSETFSDYGDCPELYSGRLQWDISSSARTGFGTLNVFGLGPCDEPAITLREDMCSVSIEVAGMVQEGSVARFRELLALL